MKMTPRIFENLGNDIPGQIDLFICSASFEQRCLSISRHLRLDRVKHAVIFRNRRFAEYVRENLDTLRTRFDGKHSLADVDSNEPVATTNSIVSVIHDRKKELRRIVIDITAFTHEALLILFRVCDDVLERGTAVDFLYSPAGEYSIGDRPGEKWLSKGIREVRSVMGFPGGFVPSRDMHLVILAGFEDYRAMKLIEELEPTLVSIGYGDRSEVGTGPHQATNEEKVARIRSVYGNVKDFVFSCYDALSAEKTIRSVLDQRKWCNTVLAPMNTKISTLGAGRVARADETIQICYVQADTYNYKNYSTPGVGYYHYNFDDYPRGR